MTHAVRFDVDAMTNTSTDSVRITVLLDAPTGRLVLLELAAGQDLPVQSSDVPTLIQTLDGCVDVALPAGVQVLPMRSLLQLDREVAFGLRTSVGSTGCRVLLIFTPAPHRQIPADLYAACVPLVTEKPAARRTERGRVLPVVSPRRRRSVEQPEGD